MIRAVKLALLWAVLLKLVTAPAYSQNSFTAGAYDRNLIERAIADERPSFAPPTGVTGITVPHHLLAADLMARGFWAASAGKYRRIIVISPDHFRAVKGKFALGKADIDTIFGRIPVDYEAASTLLAKSQLFEPLQSLEKEHGLYALMPFIEKFFPDAEIVPIAASIYAEQPDWEAAAQAIASIVDEETLVVQSTDYSHYLPVGEAALRDQETLAAIATGSADAVATLLQVKHMDSKAAQYIQAALQYRHVGARSVVIANRNSAEYSGAVGLTTSYVVTVYHRDAAALGQLRYIDQAVHYFGGDVLLGRYMTPILVNPAGRAAILRVIDGVTGGAPLIINLEGAIVGEPVAGVPEGAHLMQADIAAPFLAEAGVIAASLANNHSHDFGPQGIAETKAALAAMRIAAMEHGVVSDLGSLRVLPLSFLRGRNAGANEVANPADVRAVCNQSAAAPLVVFAHWGKEYTDEAGEPEREIAQKLAACGVSLIVGAHSHRASPLIENVAGTLQMAWSVGNFIFDQNALHSSGALLEMRIFHQGTISARLIPLPNLFELGRNAMR